MSSYDISPPSEPLTRSVDHTAREQWGYWLDVLGNNIDYHQDGDWYKQSLVYEDEKHRSDPGTYYAVTSLMHCAPPWSDCEVPGKLSSGWYFFKYEDLPTTSRIRSTISYWEDALNEIVANANGPTVDLGPIADTVFSGDLGPEVGLPD
ncbi:MAG: hypothetical protein JRH20_17175 [Deltaproteobacteria bacterium]|nr:hypothetical protein [Deltaproteobacteria bacterium]